MDFRIKNTQGVSLLETVISLGIFVLIVGGSFVFISTSLRNSKIIWAQLSGHNDSRRVLARAVQDVRRTEQSSLGAFPIVAATTSTLVFYANVDGDTYRERVRYTLVTSTIERGIIKPSGDPLSYVTSTELVQVIAHNVDNRRQRTPLFTYYDENYTGSEPDLGSVVSTTLVHLIRVQVQIDNDPLVSPVPFYAQSMVHLRNLKTN